MYRFASPDLHRDLWKYMYQYIVIQLVSLRFGTLSDHVSLKLLTTYVHTVDPRKSKGLILEQLETRTKNSRKIRFETQIKIRKSNYERGIAQHRAAHATVSQ
jgi:hypothetical protein